MFLYFISFNYKIMLINESFNKNYSSKKTQAKPIKLLKLAKPNKRTKYVRASIVLRKSRPLNKKNDNNSNLSDFSLNLFYKNSIQKNSNFENKNHDSSNEKILIPKNINDSSPNEKYFLNQTSFMTKDSTLKASMKFSENCQKDKTDINTEKKYGNYKTIMDKVNKNSLLKKIRKNFFSDKDYKNNNIDLIRRRLYKKRLQKINSSFSKESIYNLDKKILKDFSNNNILYNDSAFNDSKKIDSTNNSKKKDIIKHKKNNHSFSNGNINNKNIVKYKFIINPIFSLKQLNTKEWSKKLKEMSKNVENIIDKSIKSKTANIYSLVEKSKFAQKYQNINIYERQENIAKFHIIEKKYKNLIDPNIYKEHVQLLKMAKEEADKTKADSILNKIKEKNQSQSNKKHSIIERFRRAVVKISSFMKQRKLSENDLRNYKLIDQSFTYPETEKLINAIKNKNLKLCYKIIEEKKFILLDFDFFHLTPLHWAVKKNFYQILPALLDYGSISDIGDILGETPLHIAVKKNYYDCACILLYYLSSPFVKDKRGRKPMDVTKDQGMKNLLNKITRLYYTSYFQKSFTQSGYIQSGLWAFIKEEFQDKLKKEVIEFFMSKEIKDIFTLNY